MDSGIFSDLKTLLNKLTTDGKKGGTIEPHGNKPVYKTIGQNLDNAI